MSAARRHPGAVCGNAAGLCSSSHPLGRRSIGLRRGQAHTRRMLRAACAVPTCVIRLCKLIERITAQHSPPATCLPLRMCFRRFNAFPVSDRGRTSSYILGATYSMRWDHKKAGSENLPEPLYPPYSPCTLAALASIGFRRSQTKLTRASLAWDAGPSVGRVGGRGVAMRARRRRWEPLHPTAASQ